MPDDFQPLYLPESTQSTDPTLEKPLEIGRLEGAELSAAGAYNSTPIDGFARQLEGDAINKYAPGKHMNEDELKSAGLWREQLAKVYKGGVSENFAQVRTSEFDQRTARNEQLGSVTPGIMTDFTNVSGSFIGAALAPQNILLGAGIESAAGAVGRTLFRGTRIPGLRMLAEDAGLGERLVNRVGRGVVGGTAFQAAYSVSEFKEANQFGEDPTIMHSLYSIGAMGAVGGGFGGAVGGAEHLFSEWKGRKLMSDEHHQQAVDTAVAQQLAGKDVNVGPIVHDGISKERAREKESGNFPSDEELEEASTQLHAKGESLDTEISEQEGKVESAYSDAGLADAHKKFKGGKVEDLTAGEIVNKVHDREGDFDISDKDLAFVSEANKLPHVKETAEYIAQNKNNFSADHIAMALNKHSTAESKIIKNTIQNNKDLGVRAEEAISSSPESYTPEDIEEINSDVEFHEKQNETLANREEHVKAIDELPKEVKAERRKLAALKRKRLHIKELNKSVQYHQDLNGYAAKPTKPEDLGVMAEHMDSYTSNTTTDESAVSEFADERKADRGDMEEAAARVDPVIDELAKDGHLSPEETELKKAVDEDLERVRKLKDPLKELADCITRGPT